jgi:branched-chain amino acid transport system substrate-binding protein
MVGAGNHTRHDARSVATLTFCLGLTLGLMGCPKQAFVLDSEWVKDHADAQVRATLEEALRAYEAGDMKGSLAFLATARTRTKTPRLLAFIGLREAMAHLRLLEPSAAAEALEPVIGSGFEELASRADVLKALALFQMGRTGDAEAGLQGLDLASARKVTDDPVLQAELLTASGDILLDKLEVTGACLRYAWATRDLGPSQEDMAAAKGLLSKVDGTIQTLAQEPGTAPPTYVQLVATLPSSGPFWALLARLATQEALIVWDLPRAEKLVAELEAHGFASLAGPLAASIDSARTELEGTDPTTIGAILPLTGKNSGIGKMMKAGIETALTILNAEHAFDVVFLDTTGSPDLVRDHMRALKQEHRAIAVIGPAAGATAQAASEEAEALGMPLIALSLKPGITSKSQYVFRNFSTHDVEADLLATYAVKEAGLEKLGIVHPDSTYGKGMAKRFAKKVETLGGKVVLVHPFPPSELNFVDVASKVTEHAELQALFVPATSQQLGLLAPALAYRDVWSAPLEELGGTASPQKKRKVMILATQVAYSPNLPGKAGKYLQGSVYSSGFFAETTDPFSTFFIQEYERNHKGRVTAYHAYAADSLFIVATAVALGGVRTRAQLAAWLAGPSSCTPDMATVASFGGFDQTGEAKTPLGLFRLTGETFEALAQ